MKSDTDAQPGDVVSTVRRSPDELVCLVGPGDAHQRTYRYLPSAELAALVRRCWIPVWSVPPGAEAPQRTLQDPVSLLVISGDYARLHGVAPELSTTTLTGEGWAVGLVLAPATGYPLAGPAEGFNDRYVELEEVLGDDGRILADRVRSVIATDPHRPEAHRDALKACEDTLRRLLPLDAEGQLVNALVAAVESDVELLQVTQICSRFDIGERALQQLLRRRLGLTPKCLIQRRRLQEAAERLLHESATQADLAAAVGYADEPHMIRDFLHVTGTTPSRFTAAQRDAWSGT